MCQNWASTVAEEEAVDSVLRCIWGIWQSIWVQQRTSIILADEGGKNKLNSYNSQVLTAKICVNGVCNVDYVNQQTLEAYFMEITWTETSEHALPWGHYTRKSDGHYQGLGVLGILGVASFLISPSYRHRKKKILKQTMKYLTANMNL